MEKEQTPVNVIKIEDSLQARKMGRAIGRFFAIAMILFGLLPTFIGIVMIAGSFFVVEETTTSGPGGSYSSSSTSDFNAERGQFSLNVFISGLGATAFGAIPLGIGIAGLVRAKKSHKGEDYDGDGSGGDLQRATEEQMQMIEAGFRELGQYYKHPRKHPTKMEARATLREIQSQLAARKNKSTA